MKIAIVILNWNGEKLLRRFLPDLVKYSSQNTIYLIDNASEDNSIAFTQNNFPSVKHIINQKNLGYAGGYNLGLKNIKEDIFCLINNDVRVTEGWLLPIINLFKSQPNVAIAQPLILDEKKPDCFEYAGAAGGYIDRFGYPFCRGRVFDEIELNQNQYDTSTRIFWASGACFFIRKNVFQGLGGFDERFFMHQEEIDLCWRAFNQNYQSYFVNNSKVYHLGGGTLPNSPLKVYYNFRNSLYMLTKNVNALQLPFVLLIRLLFDGVAGIRFLLKGEFISFIYIIKAHLNFYINFFRILNKRGYHKQSKRYFSVNSIVFQFFILKKRKFSEIKFNKS